MPSRKGSAIYELNHLTTVVGSVCTCLSVTLHLTSRMSVRLKNDTIYLMGTEGQNVRGGGVVREI